ncbi:MAG TPA: ABC transporter substrate-binding protein [Synechococcales cyanobacterium M55_K2018_004]|nr:ABC transporter substrate-binding protein [Synechococcales cyanobacterium M55_K2018_004]
MTRSPSFRWSRRQALYLLSGALGGLTLHACTPATNSETASSPTSSPTAATAGSSPTAATARLAMVTWIGYVPIYIALEKGFYKELGLELEKVVFGSNPEANTAFLAGQVDGVTTVPSEAVLMAANGKDFRAVYVIDTSNGGDSILARNKFPDVQSFKGQRVALERNGVSHFFFLEVLSQAGLKESDVQIINLTPDAAAAAYQAGNVEIAVTYAPFLFSANEAQKDGRIIFDSSMLKLPTAIADVAIFDTTFVEQNPAAIAAFVRGSLKGLEYFEANRPEGLEIAGKELGLTPAELDEQLKGVKFATLEDNVNMLSNPDSNLYLLKPFTNLVGFMQETGQIKTEPDLSQLLAPQFVLKARG